MHLHPWNDTLRARLDGLYRRLYQVEDLAGALLEEIDALADDLGAPDEYQPPRRWDEEVES